MAGISGDGVGAEEGAEASASTPHSAATACTRSGRIPSGATPSAVSSESDPVEIAAFRFAEGDPDGHLFEVVEHFAESFAHHFNDTAAKEDGLQPRATLTEQDPLFAELSKLGRLHPAHLLVHLCSRICPRPSLAKVLDQLS